MSRKKSSKAQPSPVPSNKKRGNGGFLLLGVVTVAIALGGFFLASRKSQTSLPVTAPPAPIPTATEKKVEISGPVTFSKHIAPIIYENCVTCHRPGQAGPFNLLTYEDAKKRARDIARVTGKRIMPPWLPEHGYGDFTGERRLSDSQIAAIQRWVDEGATEGNSLETPPAPQFASEWHLGAPDLIVQPAAYTLAPDGKDVYFNFVTPIPTDRDRFVSGVELLSGSRVIHHAFINVDETSASRRRAAKLTPPGFYGMELPETAAMPGGQLLGWQPGKIAAMSSPGLAWVLRKNTDLVLQVHMNPSGKPEQVQPRLGLHFTDVTPTNSAFRLRLTTLQLDIPAGVSNYVAEQAYTLPVDVSLVRVGAHAHYLAKEMQGYAILPGGEKKWLLWIRDWDFKWQGDYQYKTPVDLPSGSKVVMRFLYDNSANNIRNPFNPPRRTLWGLQTTDEMGELYFQAMPRNVADLQTLGMDYGRYFAKASVDFYKFRISVNPADAEAHQRLGRAYASFSQMPEALAELNEALRLNPNDDLAYFDLGSVYLRQGNGRDAYTAFQNVIRLNPEDGQALGSLGIICAQVGRLDEARDYFLAALRVNPDDKLAAQYLQRLNARP